MSQKRKTSPNLHVDGCHHNPALVNSQVSLNPISCSIFLLLHVFPSFLVCMALCMFAQCVRQEITYLHDACSHTIIVRVCHHGSWAFTAFRWVSSANVFLMFVCVYWSVINVKWCCSDCCVIRFSVSGAMTRPRPNCSFIIVHGWDPQQNAERFIADASFIY